MLTAEQCSSLSQSDSLIPELPSGVASVILPEPVCLLVQTLQRRRHSGTDSAAFMRGAWWSLCSKRSQRGHSQARGAAPGDPSSPRATAQLCHATARRALGKHLLVLAAGKQVVGQKKTPFLTPANCIKKSKDQGGQIYHREHPHPFSSSKR